MEKVYVAKWYHLLFYPDWFRFLHQRPRRFLPALAEPGMTAADIGCGLGFYSLQLAQMVGENGRVLAVDFQPEMLKLAEKKAKKAGLAQRIQFILCRQDDLMLTEGVDFAMTMWVVHEVPDRVRFFTQIRDILNPGGQYLLAEPIFHVNRNKYKSICDQAEEAGLSKVSEPKVPASRAALFQRGKQYKKLIG